jgi:hypothetical protein
MPLRVVASLLCAAAALAAAAAGSVRAEEAAPRSRVRVGAASAEIAADPQMVIGGGIHGGPLAEQEGKLRAVAVVLAPDEAGAKPDPKSKLAIVACDILMMRRDFLDAAARRIEAERGIPFERILINATHTHHAPSTVTIHAYERDEVFCGRSRDAAVDAVAAADRELEAAPAAEMFFRLGIESSVGQNSRVLLDDGTIFWAGDRTGMLRPTGPFDPELPVIAFRGAEGGKARALIFNHSTHCIGTLKPGVRSPSFYGLASQQIEADLADDVIFLAGAFGSTHNLTLSCDEMVLRIRSAVRDAYKAAAPIAATPLAALRREFTYRVRRFDEAKEEAAVRFYCEKRIKNPESVIEVFRTMRRELASQQGEERRTWIQALRLGDVAVVAIPGEFFTVLGVEIKRRSPFRYTYIAGVANDYIGYIPDDAAYDLGGYQVWTGFHSLVERGTGERLVAEAVRLLEEL